MSIRIRADQVNQLECDVLIVVGHKKARSLFVLTFNNFMKLVAGMIRKQRSATLGKCRGRSHIQWFRDQRVESSSNIDLSPLITMFQDSHHRFDQRLASGKQAVAHGRRQPSPGHPGEDDGGGSTISIRTSAGKICS